MIILKENGRVYIAESVHLATKIGQSEAGLVEENMPVCRIPGTRALVAATGPHWRIDLDCLQYRTLRFPKTLDVPGLNKLLPEVMRRLDEVGSLKDGTVQSEMVFAKGDRAVLFLNGCALTEVNELETLGWKDGEHRYAMDVSRGLPPVERIRNAFKLMETFAGTILFPVVLWDTGTLKPTVIGREKA